jgi:uncharacterized protein YbjT (DUF2867 family)
VTILVTGATGNIGRHIVPNLLAANQKVRVLTRDSVPAGRPAEVEVVRGDLTVPSSLQPALEGVDSVYLFPVLTAVEKFVELAAQAGVRRIVLLTGSWSAGETRRDRESWTFPRYRAAEAVVEGSGLEWTILRPCPFAANLLWWAPSIRAEGLVRAPYGASACPLIHESDIGAVAAHALTEDRHAGQRYLLTGAESLTQVEQADTIGRAIGRDIRFVEVTADEWRASVSAFLRPGIIDDLLRYWSETAADPGTGQRLSPSVEEVTGAPGRTITRWAADHARDFR